MDSAKVIADSRRRLLAAADLRDAAARHDVTAALPSVVAMLIAEFGATRVVLFGSHARGTARHDSDVDLLVSGLAPGNVDRATWRASDLLGGRPVDLVPTTDVRPHVAQRVSVEGRVLHG